jgi:hypothetical protein
MGTVAFVGLLFSMLSIRLMAVVEGAQVIVAGAIGRQQQQLQSRVVAMGMGTRKFLLVRVGIAFFSKTSWLIFTVEGMYMEKVVQSAALAMLKTTISSNKVRMAAATTARHTKHAARRLHKKVASAKVAGRPGTPSF